MNTPGKNTDIGLMAKVDDAALGDHYKSIESLARSVQYVNYNSAFVIRVDGRAFHTFTRGMERPYSSQLDAMRKAAATAVLKSLKPNFAYYQSDEISFVWMPNDRPEQIHPFNGRVDKLVSICASLTSVAFYREYVRQCGDDSAIEGGALPHFDGRLAYIGFEDDDPLCALECVAWRENDAMRNSVQMLAQSMFSHKQLQGLNVYDQYLACKDAGVDWMVDVAPECRRGTYLRTATEMVALTEEQREKIPEAHRPAAGTLVPRSVLKTLFFDNWDLRARLEALVD